MKNILVLACLVFLVFITISCDTNNYSSPTLHVDWNPTVNSNDQVSIGDAVSLTILCESTCDVNLTNLVISYEDNGEVITKLDSGMNISDFQVTKTFYQDTRNNVTWKVAVMDRERNIIFDEYEINGNPDSQYGSIETYSGIRLAMHEVTDGPAYLCAQNGYLVPRDSGAYYEQDIDILCYFKYSMNNGVNTPSPTFSSPGEEVSGSGELYDIYYPELLSWQTRNQTLFDITATNGITPEKYQSCHNDSLLIHSYNDALGKRKYKWLTAGLYIPVLTARGEHGIIHVVSADTIAGGFVEFDLKIQRTEGE